MYGTSESGFPGPESEGVAVYLYLDGVSDGGAVNHLDDGSGYQAHIKKMQAGGAFASHLYDFGPLADMQFVDSHFKLTAAKIQPLTRSCNTQILVLCQ